MVRSRTMELNDSRDKFCTRLYGVSASLSCSFGVGEMTKSGTILLDQFGYQS